MNYLDFDKDFFIKDCSLNFLKKFKPEIESLIIDLSSSMDKKKFLTLDYQELVLFANKKTCKSTRWHVDGENNNYCIIYWGNCGTIFAKEDYSFKTLDLISRNKELEKFQEKGFVVPPNNPIFYNSNRPHRGVVAEAPGKRAFLRLCYSDYLRPKNKILK